MVALCLLHVGCGSALKPGCCDAQGNLAYGAKPLHTRNMAEVQSLVSEKKITQLGALRKHLGINSMGKSRTDGHYPVYRYDAWVYHEINRYSMVQDDHYLLVESEHGKIRRLGYVSINAGGMRVAGDSVLIETIKGCLNGNDNRNLAAKALAGANDRARKVVRTYRKYVDSGRDTRRFYRPAPYRKR